MTKQRQDGGPEKTGVRWQDVYQSPRYKGSLGGVNRFAKTTGLPKKRAEKILQGLLSYTLHKPRRRRYSTLPVFVFNQDKQWVADLVEMQTLARWNKGNRYLLTVIDVLSKYAWVEPVKSKTGKDVTAAFDRVLKSAKKRRPLNLQTDVGKEFYNKTFQTYLKNKDIHLFSTHGDTKAAMVERFNRTFKERMYRYFTAANKLNYLSALPRLVKGYNVTPHRSIGMAPAAVNSKNEKQVWDTLYKKRLEKKTKKSPFKVGDQVRLNKKRRPFKKGYSPGWTEEVFLIKNVIQGPVVTFKVTEWDGTPLEGTFYREELQKVTVNDIFRVEKVLQRKGDKFKVRWKGWPAKYDSWINKSDVQ